MTKDELKASIETLMNEAPAFVVIETLAQANGIGTYLKKVRSLRKEIADLFKEPRETAHRAWKALVAEEKEFDRLPLDLEDKAKASLARWEEVREQKRQEEQRKLDEDAKQAAIANALADGDQRQVKLIEQGRVAVSSVIVPGETESVSTVSTRQNWQIEIADKVALAQAIIKGDFPIDWMEFDIGAITATVRATKGQIKIPGVIARKSTTVSIRGA